MGVILQYEFLQEYVLMKTKEIYSKLNLEFGIGSCHPPPRICFCKIRRILYVIELSQQKQETH